MTTVQYTGRAYREHDGVAGERAERISGEFVVIDEIDEDRSVGVVSGALIVEDEQGVIWSITESDYRRYAEDQRY